MRAEKAINGQRYLVIHKIVVPLHPQTSKMVCKNNKYDRGVEQLVARQAHNLEVACSSPASATKQKEKFLKIKNFSFYFNIRPTQKSDKKTVYGTYGQPTYSCLILFLPKERLW